MNGNVKQEDVPLLIEEYKVCFDNWRFFVGLRFTVLAFFLTLNSALLTVYVSSIGEGAKNWLAPLMPIMGLVATVALWLIENRNRELYFGCMQRAKAIEKRLGYEENAGGKIGPVPNKSEVEKEAQANCLAFLLDDCYKVSFWGTHTRVLMFLRISFLILWIFLLVMSVLKIAVSVLVSLGVI